MTSLPRLRAAARPTDGRRLKALFLIDSLGPGGAERLMVDLLPELRRHGIDSEVVAIQERHGNPIAAELEAAGISVSTIGIERLRERGALERIDGAVQAAAPDIIHTQLEFADILGSIVASRRGIPCLSTIHTLERPARWSRPWLHFLLTSWTLRRRSNRVITVSNSARDHVTARAGLPKRLTRTIHNGIDLDPFLSVGTRERDLVRQDLGIPDSAPVVLTVAVLREPKGIDHMISALPTLLNAHPDLRYLVVGDGPHRRALEGHATAAGVAEAMNFLGRRADIPDMLAAADVFVLPSLTEALPTVLIEALASATPVVATDVGGVSEIVDHGSTGLIVPAAEPHRLAEAIDRLLTNPRHRAAMARSGRRAMQGRFSIERHAARLAEEYRVLASAAERP